MSSPTKVLDELIKKSEEYLNALEVAVDIFVNDGGIEELHHKTLLKKEELVNRYVATVSFVNKLRLLKAIETSSNEPVPVKEDHIMRCKKCGAIFNASKVPTESEERVGGTIIWKKCPKCGEWNEAEVIGAFGECHTANYLDWKGNICECGGILIEDVFTGVVKCQKCGKTWIPED